MRISMQACKQLAPPSPPPSPFNHHHHRSMIIPPLLPPYTTTTNFNLFTPIKKAAVFVMGPTGTGKSRLSIDLATHFPAEIINSDKIQIYKGLDILTNKLTPDQQRGIPHHLLSIADPNTDFTVEAFRQAAAQTADSIIMDRHKLPIIAGGSNSYIESLVDNELSTNNNYDCCFLWIDVALPVLDAFLDKRVDEMVESGMVEELKQFFNPADYDYSHGIRTAIGVPEFDGYLRNTSINSALALEQAVEAVKRNTRELARRQLNKLRRLSGTKWRMHRIDATEVIKKRLNGEDYEQVWRETVLQPAIQTVRDEVNMAGVLSSSMRLLMMGGGGGIGRRCDGRGFIGATI